jgi:SulP family sulfate permease
MAMLEAPGRPSERTKPTPAELFTPKLLTVLSEGYGASELRADVISGLTVAIVALPLSMAIAIASGATPERGLFTAVVGGLLISMLGGSRFQIGGPAAAFTVVVATTIAHHGLDGLFLATLIAGFLLLLMGVLRLGSYIKFIPYPVTVGFISGIAIILFAGQIHDLLGLTLAGKEPPDFIPKVEALSAALGTINYAAVAVALGSIVIIVGLKHLRPTWPGILIAVVAGALAVYLLHLPVETIGTRFGGIPSTLPLPAIPAFSLEQVQAVLPDALTFTLLGAIESLLSATVADGMTGRRHRSNMELVAQGFANMGAALFGGLPATGTIARTATNIRAGARGPVSGMLHAAFVLMFMLVAAPLASYIPLAGLAGVLVVVAWNMAEKHEIANLLRTSWGDAVVLLATLGLTVFRSLSEAILVGFALGALLFIHRMSQVTGIEEHVPPVPEDRADTANGARAPYDASLAADPDVVVYRISGAFFFGAAGTVASVLDRIADQHKALVLDFAAVPFIDTSAANSIAGVVRKAHRHEVVVLVSGASQAIRRGLVNRGVDAPLAEYVGNLEAAVSLARARVTAIGRARASA